eukprot:499054-Rhodomonas_salina.1
MGAMRVTRMGGRDQLETVGVTKKWWAGGRDQRMGWDVPKRRGVTQGWERGRGTKRATVTRKWAA